MKDEVEGNMSINITPFGQFARKLRIDNNERMMDMAENLSISPTYLSAVERGRRNAPHVWADKMIELYELTETEIESLRKAVSDSRTYDTVSIAHLTYDSKQLISELIEQIEHYGKEEHAHLYAMLRVNIKNGNTDKEDKDELLQED